jgi:hypothetical protein
LNGLSSQTTQIITQGGSDGADSLYVVWGNFYEPVKIEQKKKLSPLAIAGRPVLIGIFFLGTKQNKIETELFPVIGSFKTTKMMIIPA